MNVKYLMDNLDIELVAGQQGLDKEVKEGFVGDLLSVVMGTCEPDSAWITIQSHVNIIAVATLANISCIIVSQGYELDEDAIAKANEEDIPVFTTKVSSFEMARQLIKLGL